MRPRAYQLREGVALIRIGRTTAIVSGGVQPTPITSRDIESDVIPFWRAILERPQTADELVQLLPQIPQRRLEDFIDLFSRAGALSHETDDFGRLGRAQLFSGNRASRPCEAIRFLLPDSPADDFAREVMRFARMSLYVDISVGLTDIPVAERFCDFVSQGKRICICRVTAEYHLCWFADIPKRDGVLAIDLEVLGALAAHWLQMSVIGAAVSTEAVADMEIARPNDSGNRRPWGHTRQRSGDQDPRLIAPLRLAVGMRRDKSGDLKRIAPSAGGLGSAAAFVIWRGSVQDDWALSFYEPQTASLYRYAHVGGNEPNFPARGARRGYFVYLLAETSALTAKYGELGLRLAAYDLGVALDYLSVGLNWSGMSMRARADFDDGLVRRLVGATLDPTAPTCLVEIGDQKPKQQSTEPQFGDVRTLLRRRSTRDFLRNSISAIEAQELEEDVALRLRASSLSGGVPLGGVSCFRVLAEGESYIAVSAVSFGASSFHVAPRGSALHHEIYRLIRQEDLAAAPLIYLFTLREPAAPSDLGASGGEITLGRICSAFWRAALARKFVGTVYGGPVTLRTDRTLLSPGEPALCLCLGRPILGAKEIAERGCFDQGRPSS